VIRFSETFFSGKRRFPRLPRNPIAKTDFIGFGGKGFWGFLNPFLQKGV
jgi:hypothetical protein